jgi:hypothetical protein
MLILLGSLPTLPPVTLHRRVPIRQPLMKPSPQLPPVTLHRPVPTHHPLMKMQLIHSKM